MKKSEITVSMPMTSYEEFMEIKKRFETLQADLKSCFDTRGFEMGTDSCINFDVVKILNIAKNTLPVKYRNVSINYNV